MGSLHRSPSLYLDSFPGEVLRLQGKATPENSLIKDSFQFPLCGVRVHMCLCVCLRVCVCAGEKGTDSDLKRLPSEQLQQ